MNGNNYMGKILAEQELQRIERKEKKLEKAALEERRQLWSHRLEELVPAMVYTGLETAFCKAFSMVFDQGKALIEKCFDKQALLADHDVNNYALKVKAGHRELKKIKLKAKKAAYTNMGVTAVEGVALGAAGVGIPDIALFLATLLKAVYETALNYGFDYDSEAERLFILKMMETALSRGDDWIKGNATVDAMMLIAPEDCSHNAFKKQIKLTASCFASDMLLQKFVQGFPGIGLVAGAVNPVYYSKIMKYVEIKYQKRYLLNFLSENIACSA